MAEKPKRKIQSVFAIGFDVRKLQTYEQAFPDSKAKITKKKSTSARKPRNPRF